MMGRTSIQLRPPAAPHPPLARQHGHVSTRGKPWLRSSTGRLSTATATGTGTTRRLRLVTSSCTAAGRPSEPSPDPPRRILESRKYRDDMAKYAREYGAVLRAMDQWGTGTTQDAMVLELETTLFRDEDLKFGSYIREISSNPRFQNKKEKGMAMTVFISVGMAIQLSIMIAANAHLRFNESSILLSPFTVKQTIGTYVSTFLKTAEDACHMKVDRTSISAFLYALRGLAAISHILFEDALATVNQIQDGSSNYIPEYDVDRLNHELNSIMEELEKNITTASESEVYKLLRPTLTSAENNVSSFVYSMMNLRRKMVLHIEARNRQ